jgi:glycosyltransferase involved in cell wall biosynthesis
MVLRLFTEIMPQIWQQRPDVRVWIVGKDPPKELQALEETPRVVVTGSVPDIRPYLRAASIALAPLTYGAGIQNKVLEAMACGTPVVSTPLAMSGLETATGEELMVADNPLEFSQTVLALLDDPLKRLELSRAGRSYVERHHNWDQIAAQLEAIYSRASYQK